MEALSRAATLSLLLPPSNNGVNSFRKVFAPFNSLFTAGHVYSTAKETRKLNGLEIKYAEFKKCIFHVKLTVYYTVSFT